MKTLNGYIAGIILVMGISSCTRNNAVAAEDKPDPARIEERIERELHEYGGPEPRTSVFSSLNGAGAFIEKFHLSPEEIEMVGKWYPWFVGQSIKDNEYGIGIAISFLPNRIFIARSQEAVRDSGGNYLYNNYYKLGYWKVERGELKIKFEYQYTRTDEDEVGAYKSKEKIERGYYPIWKPELHEKAAVQKDMFYYDKIPKRVREAYHINGKDFLRGRFVIGLHFDGGYPSLYEEGKIWHGFLMKPELDDEQYAYNLRVMYTLSREWSYDFKENEYGLDFSRWQ